MEDTYVQSFEGSPEPADVFEPHMPGVDLFSDMDARFRHVRETLAAGDIKAAGWGWLDRLKKSGVLRARLADETDEARAYVQFDLTLTKDSEGRRQLLIER